MTQAELLLNLVWSVLCVGALQWHLWRDGRRPGSRSIWSRRTLAVLIAAVALFPCISASDDRLNLASLDAFGSSGEPSMERGHPGFLAPSMLEDLEHGQTAAPLLLSFVMCFFLMTRVETAHTPRWFSFGARGRAPPAPNVA